MERKRFEELLNLVYFSRREDGQKGDFGRLLLIGGSRQYPNALLLTGKGAICAGVGYLSFHASEEVRSLTKRRAPLSAIYLDEVSIEAIAPYDAIVFGNGLEENEKNKEILAFLLENLSPHQTLFLDATGIRLFRKSKKKHSCRLVLTPHLGEASFLLEEDGISRNPEDHLPKAVPFAKENDLFLLLKGYRSLLITPQGEVLEGNQVPTPSLAKAGTGDVLAGFLGGLSAFLLKSGVLFEEVILLADELLHECFLEAEKTESQGLLSILDFPRLLRKYLRKRHP
ncbi:MAG: NAD(P)H-hydrate dehydratase [Bacilli bacterium]|nr:NAD(P)H-hydrate dehydratase [Bacilli bacterium]